MEEIESGLREAGVTAYGTPFLGFDYAGAADHLARRLAERFGGWVSVPIVRLGKLKVFQHPGEGILVNSIDVIDECRRQGVLATLDDGKSDAQIYEDHGKTVSLPAQPEVK